MNREEILAKSRSENQKTDEMQKQVMLRGRNVSRCVGMILCALLAIWTESKAVNNMAWSIYICMFASEGLVEAVTYKKKRWTVSAAAYSVVFLGFLIIFFVNLRYV